MEQAQANRYQKFWFKGFDYQFQLEEQVLKIELAYALDQEINFIEKLTIPVSAERWEKVDKEALKRSLEMLLMIGGISYYKTFLPKMMAGVELNKGQAEFWQKIYQKGLGEFFYRNEIDFRGLINFPFTDKPASTPLKLQLADRALVPIGGGKDSLVTAELLKKNKIEMDLFSLRDAGPIRETAKIIDKPRIIVRREIDPGLFSLNEAGAYNGHVPITAYISCLLVVMSILGDYKYLVLSLEKSADYGQLLFHDMDINHQYSKSGEFEKDFRDYVQKNVSTEIEYFSFLRAWNELRIAEIFAGLPKFSEYATKFSSCNGNFKINQDIKPRLWCGDCPKCAFVFLILAPFIEKRKMLEIFGQNLLDRKDLLGLFEEILGVRNFKPFECVGTPEESQVALWMLSNKPEYKEDFLVNYFVENIEPKLGIENWEKLKSATLTTMEQGFIPEEFWKLIKNV